MVEANQINLSGLTSSNVSHQSRSAQLMEVERTTTPMRMSWWTDFSGLEPAVLSVANHPQWTDEQEEEQEQEQEQLLVVHLSEATSPQV